jgi:hypothetical protein
MLKISDDETTQAADHGNAPCPVRQVDDLAFHVVGWHFAPVRLQGNRFLSSDMQGS